jgi:mannobiose 2-epimerase
VREAALLLAQAVFEQGIDDDGGVLHFCGPGANIDSDKHWWVQAEAVAGFVNAWQISGWDHYLIAAERIWEFVEQHMVDREHGEWLWIASEPGAARAERDKAGPGKGPLPNSRACFEVMERLDAIWRGSIVVQTLPAKSLPGQRAR